MYLQPATNGETKAGWKYKPQIYWGVHMFQPKRNGLIWLWRKLRVPIFTNGPAQLVSISVKPYVKPSTFSGQWFWAWPTDDFQDGFHPRSFIPNLTMVICKRNISWGNDLRRNEIQQFLGRWTSINASYFDLNRRRSRGKSWQAFSAWNYNVVEG